MRKPGDDEEDIDADVSAGKPETQVAQHHDGDRDGAQPLDVRPEFAQFGEGRAGPSC